MKNKFFNFLNIARKSGNLLIGYNKCEEAIKKNKASFVIVTEELSQNSKDKFKKYCYDRNIKLIDSIKMSELNAYLGSSEIKIVAVTDKSMSRQLINLWNATNENN